MHLVACTPNARYVAFFSDDQVLNFRRLVDTQPESARGELKLPTTQGPGFRFDERALDCYALDCYALDAWA